MRSGGKTPSMGEFTPSKKDGEGRFYLVFKCRMNIAVASEELLIKVKIF
jgi:hypothetical protein